jgi:hypothetical protein
VVGAKKGALDLISPIGNGKVEPMLLCDILEYEQTWEDVGESLGTILYSLPLAPCESVKIAVIEAKRDDMAARTDAIDAQEHLDHSLFRDRNITEVVKGVLREKQGGSSFMAGQGAAYSGSWETVGTFGVTHAIGYASSQSWGRRNLEAESTQYLHDSTVQNTDLVRTLNSTVIVEGSQAEKHNLETRTVTNHNHCHALTVQYYEVLRRLKLETRYISSRPGLMIAYKGLGFKNSRPTVEPGGVDENALAESLTATGSALGVGVTLRRQDGDLEALKQKVLPNPDRDDLHLVNQLRPMLEPNLLEPSLAANFEAVRRLLFFEGATTPTALPASTTEPPPGDYEVKRINVTVRRGEFGIAGLFPDKNAISLRLKLTNNKYAKFAPLPSLLDKVTLEDPGFLGDDADPEPVGPIKLTVWPSLFEAGGAIRRSTLKTFEIHFDPGAGGGDFSLAGLKVVAIKPDGEEDVLVDEQLDRYFQGPGMEPFDVEPFKPPEPSSAETAAADEKAARAVQRWQDVGLAWELITHLHDHRDTYGARLVALRDPMWFAQALDQMLGLTADRDTIDSVPVAISGPYVVFGWAGSDPTARQLPAVEQPSPTYISLPTRGVLAEAQLGNCNACEKRDVTRFWKWEESPCEQAPAIEGITPGFRGEAPKVEQGQLPNAVVQITQPPAAPDPVGLAAALTLLGKGDAFRDMSGLAELQQLLSGLASGAVDLVKAQQLAKQVQAKQVEQAAGGTSGGNGAKQQTPEQRYDEHQVLQAQVDDGSLTPNDAQGITRASWGASGAAGIGGSVDAGTTSASSTTVSEASAIAREFEIARETLRLASSVATDFTYFGLDAHGKFTRVPIDNLFWFSKVYEIITYEELNAVTEQTREHPVFVLKFIPAFYRLYYDPLQLHLRKQPGVPSHWQTHFAVTEVDIDSTSITAYQNQILNCIVTGVRAHIQGDMATALVQAYRSCKATYPALTPDFEKLLPDFFELDPVIFKRVPANFFKYLSKLTLPFASTGVGQYLFGAGNELIHGLPIDTVVAWRAVAWKDAQASLGI